MSSFAEYAAAGWRLCAIDRGRKSPTYDGWNTTPIPADAVPGLDGAGLLHALSGTCAVLRRDVLFGHLHAHALRQVFHRFNKGHAGVFHQKTDGIAVLATPKTMEKLFGRAD